MSTYQWHFIGEWCGFIGEINHWRNKPLASGVEQLPGPSLFSKIPEPLAIAMLEEYFKIQFRTYHLCNWQQYPA